MTGMPWLDEQAKAAAARIDATPTHLLSPTGREIQQGVRDGQPAPRPRLYLVPGI